MKPSEDLIKGIVQILRNDSTVAGTGFIISKNLIATCAHVIQEAGAGLGDKVKVRFNTPDRKEINTFVIPERWHSVDKGDLSILQLEDELPSDVETLPIGSSAGVTGHKVSTFGFPRVGEVKGIWGYGEVRGKVTERGNSLLQIDSNEITAGFSGAPLWDESRQQVIGIIVGTFKKDQFDKLQNLAFAIPSEVLLSICPELKANEDICPYKGLFSFKEDDEHVFFGRKNLILEIVEQLRKNPRFLAAVGSSGSGKSSLMFAGVLPQILRGEIVGFENAQVVTFRPNDVSKSDNVCDSDPDESLRQALKESCINLEEDNLWEGLLTHLEKESETRLVLYADQFETLFANVDEDKQKEFIQNIYRLLKSNLKVSFLLTVRGDYYDFLLKSMLGEYLSGGQVNVRSMSIEEMREAIKKPADETGFKIEKGLEDKIITNLDNTKNPLPLLEFTLTQLWKLRSDGMLTLESYNQIGGAAGSIGQWANETYNNLNVEEKELARKIFTRLIQYGERDLPDSRRRLPLNELTGSKDKQFIRQLTRKLADAHLLVTDCELSKKAQTVEIIHDSLLIEWEQLRKWIDEHRGFLTWRQRLEDKMGEWNNNNKEEGYLLRGAPLLEAKDWLEEYKEELNRGEIKYIEASSELEEKERAEKERTRSHIIKGLAIFSFVILFLAGFATYQWNDAKNQKQIAEEKKQLAENKTKENRNLYLSSQSVSNSTFLQRNPKNMDKSVLLAIESYRIRQTVDADRLIREGLLNIPHNVMVLNHSCKVNATEFSPDGKYIATANNKTACVRDASTGRLIASINHTDSVRSINFSLDGKYLATASWDKTACVLNVSTGKNITLNHNYSLVKVLFSPDSKYIATMSKDNTAYLWNLSTGKNVTLRHDGKVNDIEFSPDGKYIATASDDKTSRLWDVPTGKQITIINKHNDKILDVTFSPDKKLIATAGHDKTVRVWSISTGKNYILRCDYPLVKASFSPDGKYLVAMSDDSMAYLWNASTGRLIADLEHHDKLNDIEFSHDGKYIATASSDRTARVWDASTGKQINVLKHDYSVTKAFFSPDGKYIATASDDETARLWDGSTYKQIAVMNHRSGVSFLVFSPDGKYVATLSDKKVYVWDTSTEIPVLNHNNSVVSVEFSPDGKYVATASRDSTARIWDSSSGKQIVIMNHSNGVNKIAFSPDGKYIATASDDKTARVWNTFTGESTTRVNHTDRVNDVEFSHDGEHIATASDDKTARVWNIFTDENITLNHNDSVLSVSFSPDGKYIATASGDKTAHVWSASTGQNITVLRHRDKINKIKFSPDGKYVATASDDKTAHVWDAFTGENLSAINHTKKVRDVAFSPDVRRIATASWDKTVCVKNISTGENITLSHDDYVSRVVFSPDGKLIATTSYGRIAFLWNSSTGEKIASISHDGVVNDIAFSPDGKQVATASDDNTARVWVCKIESLINESSHCLTRNFTPEEWKKYMVDSPYHKTCPDLP